MDNALDEDSRGASKSARSVFERTAMLFFFSLRDNGNNFYLNLNERG